MRDERFSERSKEMKMSIGPKFFRGFLLAIILFSLAGDAEAKARPAFQPAPYFAPEHFLTVGGAPICYVDQGQGETMILVHGWAGNIWNWLSVFGPLAEHHRVIALDLPGHGKSGCPQGFGFTMPEYAKFLVQVMDQLKIEKATVVGSSMGGAIVVWTAILAPERVDRLVIVDGAGTSIQNNLMRAAGYLVSPATVIPLIHLAFPVNEKTLAAVPDSEKKRVILAEQLYASDRRPCASQALAKSMRSLARDIVDSRLSEIKAPTLVIWGSDDGLLPRAAGQFYQSHVANAKLVIIENGNHTPMQWQPQAFLKEINNFLP